MQTHFVSLYYHADRDADQWIEPGAYRNVLFPYGSLESTDREDMHALVGPDGLEHPYSSDQASALIWPKHSSTPEEPVIGHLWACAYFEPGNYTEIRGQFSRDPLGINDVTGTVHLPPSPGVQCFTFSGPPIEINEQVPLALQVMHNSTGPRKLTHAKLKLTYYTPALAIPPE